MKKKNRFYEVYIDAREMGILQDYWQNQAETYEAEIEMDLMLKNEMRPDTALLREIENNQIKKEIAEIRAKYFKI